MYIFIVVKIINEKPKNGEETFFLVQSQALKSAIKALQ
jgi:hypothetical protein